MDEFSSNQATDSHTLHLNSNSNQVAADDATQTQTQIRSQSAAGDGSQAEIITMDASLYKAAADGNIHALQQFPEVDLQIQSSPKENSVLHIAAQFGQLRCVKWMLEFPWCSSLLHRQNLKGDTPLHLAAREGHLLVLRALMDAAKLLPLDIESGIGAEKAMLRLTNKGGDTALHEAVRYNNSEVVKFLIMEDPEFAYSENIDGGTPLYMAAERGFGKLVEIIIDNTRTSPGYTGFTGRTVLHAAVIHNNTEMTKKILEWKPALTKEVDENGWSPLHYAARRGCNTTIIRQLLDKSDKSVPYLRIKDGNLTALHIAARHGRMKMVEILASHSPDCCEQVDDKGKNVFHFAMMKKKAYASGDLLRNRWLRVTGLINEKDGEGDTPLHLLASHQVFDPHFVWDDKVDRMAFNNQRFTAMDIYSKAKNACIYLIHQYFGEISVTHMGPKRWQEVSKGDDDSGRSQGNEGNNQDTSNLIKRKGETHLIVAALIATGFTLPGGYNQSNGMAILSKKAAFKAFVVMDTIAMVLSVSAVFYYLFMSLHVRKVFLDKHIIRGFLLTMFAMVAMVVAFMTGLYAVLPHSSWIPIFICIFCCCFFFSFCSGWRLFFQVHKVRIRFSKKSGAILRVSW
ncbi:hypothetical protein AAG906_015253 [Vitis piasezkii]